MPNCWIQNLFNQSDDDISEEGGAGVKGEEPVTHIDVKPDIKPVLNEQGTASLRWKCLNDELLVIKLGIFLLQEKSICDIHIFSIKKRKCLEKFQIDF